MNRHSLQSSTCSFALRSMKLSSTCQSLIYIRASIAEDPRTCSANYFTKQNIQGLRILIGFGRPSFNTHKKNNLRYQGKRFFPSVGTYILTYDEKGSCPFKIFTVIYLLVIACDTPLKMNTIVIPIPQFISIPENLELSSSFIVFILPLFRTVIYASMASQLSLLVHLSARAPYPAQLITRMSAIIAKCYQPQPSAWYQNDLDYSTKISSN